MIPYHTFRDVCDQLREEVLRLKQQNKVDTASHLHGSIDEVIDHGLKNVGLYHSQRPLLKNQNGDVITMNLNTLYYYRNRLEGYGLDRLVKPMNTLALDTHE